MSPERAGVRRREQRKAWKGTPAGRRRTHKVKTAYGQQQRLRAAQEAHSAFCAALRAARQGT